MLWCVSPAGGGVSQWVFQGAWTEFKPHPLTQPSLIWRDPSGLNGNSSCVTVRNPSIRSVSKDYRTSEADCDSGGIRAAASPETQSRVHLKPSLQFGEDLYKMPRSFLVKKYFSNKKPNYSELESQTGECAFKSCLLFYAISVCELKQLMFSQNLTQSYHNILHHKCWHNFLKLYYFIIIF